MEDKRPKGKGAKPRMATLDELLRLSEADRMSPIEPKEAPHKEEKAEKAEEAGTSSASSQPTPVTAAVPDGASAPSQEAAPSAAAPPPVSVTPKSAHAATLADKVFGGLDDHLIEIRRGEVRRGLMDTIGIRASEFDDLLEKSPFLLSLREYEDRYISRRQKYERKAVLIDITILNTLESLSFYRMCKSNLVNALLEYCINEHREELVTFVKKYNKLL